MSDEIRADYDQLEQIATRFSRQAQEVQQMLQQVRNSMGKLENGGWIGRGSQAFFAEMNSKVLPASNRLQQALTEASRSVKEISQTIRQAEEEASAVFRQS
ncbi:MAG: WXG100 family type VII secretion target [Caldilineaceae bacterium]|nr:WXG100 family type VII secretion target [Caldilineaceae bacterium]